MDKKTRQEILLMAGIYMCCECLVFSLERCDDCSARCIKPILGTARSIGEIVETQ